MRKHVEVECFNLAHKFAKKQTTQKLVHQTFNSLPKEVYYWTQLHISLSWFHEFV
jgi:hypothetical protein